MEKKELTTPFNYAVIKHNHKELERESTLLPSKWSNKKYAMLLKQHHKDSSESISFIKYSNNLEELQCDASKYETWYNYPIGLYKELQGNILQLA